jgi:hypothetical protein
MTLANGSSLIVPRHIFLVLVITHQEEHYLKQTPLGKNGQEDARSSRTMNLHKGMVRQSSARVQKH